VETTNPFTTGNDGKSTTTASPKNGGSGGGAGGVVVVPPVIPMNPGLGGSGGSASGPREKDPEHQEPDDHNSKISLLDQQSITPVSQLQQLTVSSSSAISIPSPASSTGNAQSSSSAASSSTASRSASSIASSTASCSTCDVCLTYGYSPKATPNPLDDDADLKKRKVSSRFNMVAFFDIATYWAVATTPACNGASGWAYVTTNQLTALPNPYTLG